MVRCCGLTQHYFLEVRFHLSPFGSRFEDPFNWIFFEDPFIWIFLWCIIQDIVFWILSQAAGPRHGLPTSGSVTTRVTESQPPFLQSYLALVCT